MAKATPLTGITPTMPLTEAARRVVRRRTADLTTWAKYIHEPEAVGELHNMRIAAKRLRYSLELLQPGLPAETVTLLNAVQQLQERLGAIHDDDVLLARLHDHIAVEALRAAQDQAHIIVQARGSVEMEGAQPPRLQGLYRLLAVVARRRHDKYTAAQDWWVAHPELPNSLFALGAAPSQ